MAAKQRFSLKSKNKWRGLVLNAILWEGGSIGVVDYSIELHTDLEITLLFKIVTGSITGSDIIVFKEKEKNEKKIK